MNRLLLLLLTALSARLFAADHGVILLYHHVSTETPAVTSVTPQQFEQHLRYINEQGFNVIPLSKLLQSVYTSGQVPENAVAITFDDAYLSVYTQAFPRLRARAWPFSVFISSQAVDQQYGQFMTWKQMREMALSGAEFGGHSLTHSHLVRRLGGESQAQWRKRIAREVSDNITRIKQELNIPVTSFAYPYGEFTDALTKIVAEEGYYGLGQHSGAVGSLVSPVEIPRFPMMRGLADIKRLAVALNSRPLPIKSINTGPRVRKEGDESGVLSMQLEQGAFHPHLLSCFSSHGERLNVERRNDTFWVRLPEFVAGRNKVNCTVPSTDRTGEFFWFSHQWLVQKADGQWPKE